MCAHGWLDALCVKWAAECIPSRQCWVMEGTPYGFIPSSMAPTHKRDYGGSAKPLMCLYSGDEEGLERKHPDRGEGDTHRERRKRSDRDMNPHVKTNVGDIHLWIQRQWLKITTDYGLTGHLPRQPASLFPPKFVSLPAIKHFAYIFKKSRFVCIYSGVQSPHARQRHRD